MRSDKANEGRADDKPRAVVPTAVPGRGLPGDALQVLLGCGQTRTMRALMVGMVGMVGMACKAEPSTSTTPSTGPSPAPAPSTDPLTTQGEDCPALDGAWRATISLDGGKGLDLTLAGTACALTLSDATGAIGSGTGTARALVLDLPYEQTRVRCPGAVDDEARSILALCQATSEGRPIEYIVALRRDEPAVASPTVDAGVVASPPPVDAAVAASTVTVRFRGRVIREVGTPVEVGTVATGRYVIDPHLPARGESIRVFAFEAPGTGFWLSAGPLDLFTPPEGPGLGGFEIDTYADAYWITARPTIAGGDREAAVDWTIRTAIGPDVPTGCIEGAIGSELRVRAFAGLITVRVSECSAEP